MKLLKDYGIFIPQKKESEEEFFMANNYFVNAKIKVLSKVRTEFTGKDGLVHPSCKLNASQEDDKVIMVLSVNQSIFDSCEKGGNYELIGEYRTTQKGSYISWQNAIPLK